MKRTLLSYVLLVTSLTSACSGTTTAQNNNLTNKPSASQATKKDESRERELEDQIGRIAAEAKGHVGVSALVLETGEEVSLNPHDHFPMQSVYKLPIGMALMREVDAGKMKIDQRVRVEKSDFVGARQHSPIRDKNPQGVELSVEELLRYAISESDGTASDVMLRLAGGAGAVNNFLSGIKVSELVVANTEKEIGSDWQVQYRNWSSPDGAINLLRALYERRGLSEQSQSLLLKLLIESTPGVKRLKGLLPAGTAVAHKTGTSNTQDGITAATNDIGILTLPNGHHLAIAVFVSDSSVDEATREGVIAKVARAVWDKLGS
ncbi:MAG: beta-lactamase class [Acidobacteriota bacterium]|nr:beta-lactamase class [Acidobacteriota bacterium]